MEDAAIFFRGKERYNCAQAIAKAFQEEYGVSQELIDSFKAYGSGRAEDGLCGALFAAKHLLKNKNRTEELKKRFKEAAGDICCKNIRKLNHTPCVECVRIAAKILHDLDHTI